MYIYNPGCVESIVDHKDVTCAIPKTDSLYNALIKNSIDTHACMRTHMHTRECIHGCAVFERHKLIFTFICVHVHVHVHICMQ